MSWAICSYQDCLMQRFPFSKIAFFRLPQTEPRRSQWIINSGNKSLLKLKQTQTRFICEKHFRVEDIRNQFNRKLLRKEAVPVSYDPDIEHFVLSSDEQLEDTENENVLQISSTVGNNAQNKLWSNHSTHGNKSPELLEIASAQDIAHEGMSEDDQLLQNEIFAIVSQESSDFVELASESNMEIGAAQEVNASITENDVINEAASSTIADDITDPPGSLSKANNPNREQQQHLPNKSPESERHFSLLNMIENYDVNETATSTVITRAEDMANSAYQEQQHLVNESYESDRHFALSLVHQFQRLNARKKAHAKLKILTYLTALEFEDDEAELS